jgi:ribosome biogenesis protein SSF1/2
VQRKAVRLDEVGPRIELRLIKISEGVPGKGGAVMYHGFGVFSLVLCLIKSLMVFFKEIEAQKAEHAAKATLKAQRMEE